MDELFERFFDRYLNRTEVAYRLPLEIDRSRFWAELTRQRQSGGRSLPLPDQSGTLFWYSHTRELQANLDQIEQLCGRRVFNASPDQIRSSAILDALIDEAMSSSIIEGAFSSKKRTQEMIQRNRNPASLDEQMIVNNFRALQFILEHLNQPIDETMLLAVYRILTAHTLAPEDQTDTYRDDAVIIWDHTTQRQVYEAPKASEVRRMMDLLFQFIHGPDDLHPFIKSCVIHFYLVYVHPFFDGNGRTARAISHMYLLQQGYDIFKFFSISSVIREEKARYYKSIQDTEENESDLTYFLHYCTEMIIRSIRGMIHRFEIEYRRRVITMYIRAADLRLSERQQRSVSFFLKHDDAEISIDQYAKKYKVSYETARGDLVGMERAGLLVRSRTGRKHVFRLHTLEDLLGIEQVLSVLH
ncbi:MAG: Fic family protein [Solirubrobacterales bacterium]